MRSGGWLWLNLINPKYTIHLMHPFRYRCARKLAQIFRKAEEDLKKYNIVV